MATSDLHMQMTAYDYVRDQQTDNGSLAKIATLINAERSDAARTGRTCVLFDNGDTIQGTPVADFIAKDASQDAHPIVAMLDALDYDAVGLGNHDLDFGLNYLSTCLSQLSAPAVCSNMKTSYLPMVRRDCILVREFDLGDGTKQTLRIGIVSSLPEKTALWSRLHLENRVQLSAPVPALQKAARALRAEGADLVIALAHMGIAPFDEGADAQNQIHEVAQLTEIDMIIGGHTHLRFPGPDHAGIDHVDARAGKVHGKPVVQPGASASDLGVVDLTLKQSTDAATWYVDASEVRLVPVNANTKSDPKLAAIAKPAHEKTKKYLSASVARLAQPMHSFFALAHPSALPALLAQAKMLAIREAVSGTEYADLPLLAAASVPLTGGLEGPDNFLYLDAGPLKRRHIAGMNPYANNVWAVKTTGAQIEDWLERSALIFNQLKENATDQELVDPRVPGFRYDAIYGLTYSIDLREPARFDAAGRIQPGVKGRIKNIMWNGAPLDPSQPFLVATTDHRAGGGGLYEPFSNDALVVRGRAPLQEAVLHYFSVAKCDVVRSAKPWHFIPEMHREAVLLTSPQAAKCLDDIAHLSPEICGQTKDGFLRIRLQL